jgi:hypothetical protein
MVHLHNELLPSTVASARDLTPSASFGSSSHTLAGRNPEAFSETLQQLGIDVNRNKLASDTESGRTIVSSQNPAAETTASSTPASTSTPAYLIGFNALVPRDPVTTTTASPTTVSTTAPSPSATLNDSLVGFNALVPRDTAAASTVVTDASTTTSPASTTSSSSPFAHWYADNAADDAYWSQQPPAVQQLREIQNPEQRQALASQLASEGYTIDNAIMVWGWDAGQVTAARQADGYTWVPSATQASVTAAPGLTAPGLTPYDPNNPPAGSIIVPPATTATTPAMS